jgi:inner membrane protein
MLFHTHILFGIVFFLLLKDYFSGGNEVIFFFIVLFGSILPDIDDGKSKIKKASGIIGSVISFVFKHRGIFHSIFMALTLFFLTHFFWKSYYAWAILIGYSSHLFADILTPMGIRIFYPLSNFKIKGPIRVGSVWEFIILLVLIVLVIKELLF